MFKPILRVFVLLVLSILLSIQGSTNLTPENQAQLRNQELFQNLDLSPDFGKIPLYFIPNRGQVDETALFYAKTSRYTLWLTKEGLVFDSTRRMKKESPEAKRLSPREENNPKRFKHDRDVSRLIFVNANRSPEIIPIDRTEHKVNYLIGNDESEWRTNIQTSREVLYRELYPNIDLKVYGIERQIEYDFVVKPGGEVSNISFEYKYVEKTRIDKEGNLVIKTKFGKLEHAKPVCYQVIEGERVEIQAEFMKIGDNNYGFKVRGNNRNYELIIDPLVLVYSTYLGGSDWERGNGIAVDSEGAAYVTGYTYSIDFPTQNPIQGTYAGHSDIFIVKVNSSGSALIYSTYLGGSGWEKDSGIAVDSEGAAYVTGQTNSIDFPTQNPIQGTYAGPDDAFIVKVNASGSALIYSTYLGGSDNEYGNGIAVDSEGAAYVAGYTESINFPTQNPIHGTNAGQDDAFIVKVNASGSALIYSTYLGGSGWDYGNGIAVDSEGAAYVTGDTSSIDFPTQNPIQGSNAGANDVFIVKVNSSGSAIIYSTYLGGFEWDYGFRIAVDSEGAAYVTGYTSSIDFPTKNPIQGSFGGGEWDGFIAKVNSSGSALIYSTYLGGSGRDLGFGMAVDSEGAAYVTGWTDSFDFPTKSPIQEIAGDENIFIVKVNSSGSALIYSTYLGGSTGSAGGRRIAVDSEGAAYVTGQTWDNDFPTQNPIQGTNAGLGDAFIAKLYFTPSLTITAGTGGTTNPKPGTYTYDEGTVLSVEAIPDADYNFLHWTGDVPSGQENDNPITIIMDSDKSIKANFQYTLTITAGTGGTTDPLPGIYNYHAGTAVTVTAIPNSGYEFSGWSGDASGTTNPITITMDSDKSITANFTKEEEEKKGPCFIATATYGSPFHPHVKILQDFRDKYLISSKPGHVLVDLYYKYSPSMASFIAKHKALKVLVRSSLLPLVAFSYSMLHFGPIITAVMIVLIFMFPVFLILFFKRNLKQVEAKSPKARASLD